MKSQGSRDSGCSVPKPQSRTAAPVRSSRRHASLACLALSASAQTAAVGLACFRLSSAHSYPVFCFKPTFLTELKGGICHWLAYFMSASGQRFCYWLAYFIRSRTLFHADKLFLLFACLFIRSQNTVHFFNANSPNIKRQGQHNSKPQYHRTQSHYIKP